MMATRTKANFVYSEGCVNGLLYTLLWSEIYIVIYALVDKTNIIFETSSRFVAVFSFGQVVGVLPAVILGAIIGGSTMALALQLKKPSVITVAQLGGLVSIAFVFVLLFIATSAGKKNLSEIFLSYYGIPAVVLFIGSMIYSARSASRIPDHLKTGKGSTIPVTLLLIGMVLITVSAVVNSWPI